MKPGIDPKVDYAFKRLFGVPANRPLLIHALNAVLQWPPGRRLREVELLNPFNDKEYVQDKLTVVDIKARDQAGRQHHVEMQLAVPWGFDKRIVYYWAKFHQQQMQEGDYYQTLCPTTSVWWLNENLLDDAPYHHKFQLWDHERGVLLSKDLEIHTIELSKFKVPAEKITTPLEQWCYFLKHGATLDTAQLPASLDNPSIRQALEILMVVSQSELERYRYEDRLRAQRDAASLQYDLEHGRRLALEQGREEGLEQGLEQGLDQGLKQGLDQGLKQGLDQGLKQGLDQGLKQGLDQGLKRGQLAGQIRLCQRLLAQPLLSDDEVRGSTLEQLTELAGRLERQLLAARQPPQEPIPPTGGQE